MTEAYKFIMINILVVGAAFLQCLGSSRNVDEVELANEIKSKNSGDAAHRYSIPITSELDNSTKLQFLKATRIFPKLLLKRSKRVLLLILPVVTNSNFLGEFIPACE